MVRYLFLTYVASHIAAASRTGWCADFIGTAHDALESTIQGMYKTAVEWSPYREYTAMHP